MKVAVCISGHLRSFEHCAESLRNSIADPLRADVYVHTWDALDNITTKPLGHELARAFELYRPAAMLVEKPKGFDDMACAQWRSSHPLRNCISMWYGVHRVMELRRQSGVKYDVVLRCRPDHKFPESIPMAALQDTSKLWLATVGHWASGLSDQFAFGSDAVMDDYGSLFSQLATYLSAEFTRNPEMLAEEHFRRLGTPLDFVDIKMDLIRRNGLAQPQEHSRIGSSAWWRRLLSHGHQHTYGFREDGSRESKFLVTP
jgi:hypothetical protein